MFSFLSFTLNKQLTQYKKAGSSRRSAQSQKRARSDQRVAALRESLLQAAADRDAAAEQPARAVVASELSVPWAVRLSRVLRQGL